MQNTKQIKSKAMCLLLQDGYILVGDGNSFKSNVRKVVPGNFYRVLGGHLEHNENPEEAVRREIMEESGLQIKNLKFLETFKNDYVYAGEKNHELISLFVGEPKEDKLDKSKVIHKVEDTYEFDVVWISVKEVLQGKRILRPERDYSGFLTQ